ncbi:MAG: PHB depolymerase family esterase [Kofleriaceae bacterium]
MSVGVATSACGGGGSGDLDGGLGRDAADGDGGAVVDAPADGATPPIDAPAATSGCGRVPGANDRTWTVTSGGRDRTFRVHLPTGYSPTTPTPVVVNFHGRNSTSQQQALLSGMNGFADGHGFIAVHPDGVGQTWNGGLCCGEAQTANVDDVGFTRALLDKLDAELCVDPDRVFATGLSNGGFMVHRLACELADRIAAVAAVAGPNGAPTCSPARPIAVLHFHGDADMVVPYDGIAGQLAVRPTMTAWAQRDGCGPTSTVDLRAGEVTCEQWPGCQAGSAVRLCTIAGGGHQWPGGLTIPGLGHNTTDISATAAMWDFFVAHPR